MIEILGKILSVVDSADLCTICSITHPKTVTIDYKQTQVKPFGPVAVPRFKVGDQVCFTLSIPSATQAQSVQLYETIPTEGRVTELMIGNFGRIENCTRFPGFPIYFSADHLNADEAARLTSGVPFSQIFLPGCQVQFAICIAQNTQPNSDIVEDILFAKNVKILPAPLPFPVTQPAVARSLVQIAPTPLASSLQTDPAIARSESFNRKVFDGSYGGIITEVTKTYGFIQASAGHDLKTGRVLFNTQCVVNFALKQLNYWEGRTVRFQVEALVRDTTFNQEQKPDFDFKATKVWEDASAIGAVSPTPQPSSPFTVCNVASTTIATTPTNSHLSTRASMLPNLTGITRRRVTEGQQTTISGDLAEELMALVRHCVQTLPPDKLAEFQRDCPHLLGYYLKQTAMDRAA